MRKPNQTNNNAPVHRIRSGALSVSIWEKDGQNGPWYSANVQRAYTEDNGQTWQHTDSMNRDDLPVAQSLMLQAHAWICRKEADNAAKK